MSTDALPLPDLSALPDDPATLRQLVLQLLEALRGKDTELSKLQHHMDLLLRRLYGRSSEKIDPLQLLLFERVFEEALAIAEPLAAEPAGEAEAAGDKRPGHGRRPKPDHLKRVDVVHDLTEAEKQALAGEGELVLIGEEITEQYEWEPSCLYIVRHIQKKYAKKPQLVESGAASHEKNVITAPQAARADPRRDRRAGPDRQRPGPPLRGSSAVSSPAADHRPARLSVLAADHRWLGLGRGGTLVRARGRRDA